MSFDEPKRTLVRIIAVSTNTMLTDKLPFVQGLNTPRRRQFDHDYVLTAVSNSYSAALAHINGSLTSMETNQGLEPAQSKDRNAVRGFLDGSRS